MRATLRLDADVAARGVRCRMLVARSSLGVAYWSSYLQDLIRRGHQVRTHEGLPQQCTVIDETTAVIPAGRDGTPGSAYVLHGRGLVAPVQALFDELWARRAAVRRGGLRRHRQGGERGPHA